MLIWIGGVRFLLEFLRIGNWRLADIPTAQIFGAAFVAIGIGILVAAAPAGRADAGPGREASDDADDEDMIDVETYGDDIDAADDETKPDDRPEAEAEAAADTEADHLDEEAPPRT